MCSVMHATGCCVRGGSTNLSSWTEGDAPHAPLWGGPVVLLRGDPTSSLVPAKRASSHPDLRRGSARPSTHALIRRPYTGRLAPLTKHFPSRGRDLCHSPAPQPCTGWAGEGVPRVRAPNTTSLETTVHGPLVSSQGGNLLL